MPFIVGNEILAFCPACGRDTTHLIVSLTDGKVRKVRCGACKDEHRFHRPKKAKAGAVAAKPKERRRSKKSGPAPDPWKEAMQTRDGEEPKPYAFSETYQMGEIIDHQSFGKGIVQRVVSHNKMHVLFEDGIKIMVCNREM